MYENNTSSKKRLIIIGIVVVVILIVGVSLAAGGNGKNNVKQQQISNTGTVTLHYNTTDIENSVVKFNGQKVTPSNATTSGSATYNVAPNTYKLSVADPGYSSFSTNFSLSKGQTVVVDVHIQIVVNQNPTITSIKQVPLPGVDTTNTTITNVTYFNNNTWAVVTFQTEGNVGIAVTQYSAEDEAWLTVLGPGTTFTLDSLQGTPQNVQDYLTANNYVNPEGE